MPGRIGEQVDQDVVQQPRIGAHQRQRAGDGEIDAVVAQRVAQIMDRAAHRVGEIERLGRELERTGVDPHHVDQIVEEALEPLHFGAGEGHRRRVGGIGGQCFHRASDSCERRAQIMPDRREQRGA